MCLVFDDIYIDRLLFLKSFYFEMWIYELKRLVYNVKLKFYKYLKDKLVCVW